jgi:hypothetical protein
MDNRGDAGIRIASGEIGLNGRGTARRALWAALVGLVTACPVGGVLTDMARHWPELGLVLEALGWGFMLTPFALVAAAAALAVSETRSAGAVAVEGDALVLERDGRAPRRIKLSKLAAGYLSAGARRAACCRSPARSAPRAVARRPRARRCCAPPGSTRRSGA